MSILNFIINEIFGQGAIFLSLVAMVGLILQKKSVSEVVRGTLMTAIGFFVLNTGTGLITGNSIDGIITKLRGDGFSCEDAMVYVHVGNLRRKLGSAASMVVNHRSEGYVLVR